MLHDRHPADCRNRVARMLNVLTLGGPSCHPLAVLFLPVSVLSFCGSPVQYPFGARATAFVSRKRDWDGKITYQRGTLTQPLGRAMPHRRRDTANYELKDSAQSRESEWDTNIHFHRLKVTDRKDLVETHEVFVWHSAFGRPGHTPHCLFDAGRSIYKTCRIVVSHDIYIGHSLCEV